MLANYENNIYIKSELDKNIFDESYYSKYHRVIKNIVLYGSDWNRLADTDENSMWGGWSGNKKWML